MRSSKYSLIDTNILIEYIYDDGNLISEGYNVLTNSLTGLNTFISRMGGSTNNDLRNTIYRIDPTFDRYGSIILDPNVPEKISDSIPSIQLKNFAPSAPVRYDEVRIHIPVNWTFGEKKGAYVRIYTYNFDESKQIDLSNYYFDISDYEMVDKMEYSSNILLFGERQWGKYLKIKFPSVTKISDQRLDNVTRPNSINFNLTEGIGVSKKSPVFIDFHFIDKVDLINNRKFFTLGSRITTSFPQTPDFENIGVEIQESTQGDFFVIYGTYNGTLGEFNTFINESYYTGNRYYVEYIVDLYEKNEKIKSQTFLVNEEFNQSIEYRPIVKFSTTTAMIQVTMNLVDITNGDKITRKSSFGIIQEDVSKYSRSLSKINLKGAIRPDVFNIKSVIQSTTGDSPFGTRPILILDRLPFILWSKEYNVYMGKGDVDYENERWLGLNNSIMNIYPFDNIIKFNIIEADGGDGYRPYDLTSLRDVKLSIRSDKKSLDFHQYQDSDQNQFELGEIVFKISGSKYNDIRSINLERVNVYYINGIDSTGNRIIVYSGVFIPFDSSSNVRRYENDWALSQKTPDPPRPKSPPVEDLLINKIINLQREEVKPTGVFRKNSLLFKNTFKNINLLETKFKRVTNNFDANVLDILSSIDSVSIKSFDPPLPPPEVEILPETSQNTNLKYWVVKRKSLATRRTPNFVWVRPSPVTVYDVYVKSDGSGTTSKPTLENISTYMTVRAENEQSAKNQVFETKPGISMQTYASSSWPHFETVIYDATKPIQLQSFATRVNGGPVGQYTTIDDHGKVYYVEELDI